MSKKINNQCTLKERGIDGILKKMLCERVKRVIIITGLQRKLVLSTTSRNSASTFVVYQRYELRFIIKNDLKVKTRKGEVSFLAA
jgi:hypothetical protein